MPAILPARAEGLGGRQRQRELVAGGGQLAAAGLDRLAHGRAHRRAADELDAAVHERALTTGLSAAAQAGISGKDVTPFLLDWFHRETQGASLAANIALVLSNARLAAEVAVEYCRR